jgi:hypothetical protein
MQDRAAQVDFALLRRFSALLLCSGCLKQGRRTPVAQVISHRHRPRSLCPECQRHARHGAEPGTG